MSVRIKSVQAWAVYRPTNKGLLKYGISFSPAMARYWAVKGCTVYGGQAEGETWRRLYKEGYRVVKVDIVPR